MTSNSLKSNVPKLDQLKTLIDQSKHLVVFTGAGISTESGIPDFRSKCGIWTKYKPIDFRDFVAEEGKRRESWRMKFATEKLIADAKPNIGHLKIAKLYQQGKLSAVITQNIDGLHQAAGLPDDKVIELHGNCTYATCLECNKRYELDEIRRIFFPNETLPICDQCGGMIKTATISFGQSMPSREMQLAEEAALSCDLFIAMGSSLVVYPAASFPIVAKKSGASLTIINRDPTKLDRYADLVIHAEIGMILKNLKIE
jgi:NAD-dependent deacetylase